MEIEKKNKGIGALYILKILWENTDEDHALTREEIEKALKKIDIVLERKTIYAYIKALQDFGFDIIMEKRGRNSYYYIGQRGFETAELKLLVDAVQASRFISERRSKKLIRKLSSLTNKFESKKLNRQVYIEGRTKTDNKSIYYSIDKIHNAIEKNESVFFKYFDYSVDKKKINRHNGKVYHVSPWELVWNDQNYYLIGFDEAANAIHHYRVDKIVNIELTGNPRIGNDCYEVLNLPEYLKKHFKMFGGDTEVVKLKVKNENASLIFDRFGLDTKVQKLDDDYFCVDVEVAVSKQFLCWVLSLGDIVEVVEPQSVIEEIKEICRSTLDIYG